MKTCVAYRYSSTRHDLGTRRSSVINLTSPLLYPGKTAPGTHWIGGPLIAKIQSLPGNNLKKITEQYTPLWGFVFVYTGLHMAGGGGSTDITHSRRYVLHRQDVRRRRSENAHNPKSTGLLNRDGGPFMLPSPYNAGNIFWPKLNRTMMLGGPKNHYPLTRLEPVPHFTGSRIS